MEKQKFHQYKRPILIKNVDTIKIIVSNKAFFGKNGFKYFIFYKQAQNVRALCIWVHIENALMKLNIYLF